MWHTPYMWYVVGIMDDLICIYLNYMWEGFMGHFCFSFHVMGWFSFLSVGVASKTEHYRDSRFLEKFKHILSVTDLVLVFLVFGSVVFSPNNWEVFVIMKDN